MSNTPWPDVTVGVMGVVNVTPDSFSGDGLLDAARAVDRGQRHVAEGAIMIDVGGESTRPGFTSVTEQEERRRVVPVVQALSGKLSVPVSIDTCKAEVARAALAAGADLVNDVSGLRDAAMLDVVRDAGAGLVLVHTGPVVDEPDPVGAVIAGLDNLVSRALAEGVTADRLAVDPGFGIGGKTWRDNFVIMRGLDRLTDRFDRVLVGVSRKRMIGVVLGVGVDDRLEGSLALAALCAAQGARLVRAHDVARTWDAVRTIAALKANWGLQPNL